MKLTDKIHLLKIDFDIELSPEKKLPRFVNVLIVFGNSITLVDCGVKGSEEKIFRYIESFGRKKEEIGTLILSHSHPDHMGSAAQIKELTGCRILCHPFEKDWIENIDIQFQKRPVPGFYNLVNRSVAIDEFLTGDQIIKVASEISARIIYSPGHSKGSVNIFFEEDRILFTADSIPLKNDIPNYYNFQELKQSLQTIKNNDEYSILLTSWTPPLLNKTEANRLIVEGEQYLCKLDRVVQEFYMESEKSSMESCKLTVQKLALPPFFINPLVDNAFKSHLKI